MERDRRIKQKDAGTPAATPQEQLFCIEGPATPTAPIQSEPKKIGEMTPVDLLSGILFGFGGEPNLGASGTLASRQNSGDKTPKPTKKRTK